MLEKFKREAAGEEGPEDVTTIIRKVHKLHKIDEKAENLTAPKKYN